MSRYFHLFRQRQYRNRIQDFYQEREQITTILVKTQKDPEIVKQLTGILENIEFRIYVYEKELPIRVVERAKRSAGLYKEAEEYANSIKREEADIEASEKLDNIR